MNSKWLLMLLVGAASCSTASSRFETIVPGMNSWEVRHTMDAGPTRFETAPNTDYSVWHWDNDFCVLFKSGRVISKQAAEARGKSAQCKAPAQT
ncbi:MAG: hypothetical protein ACXVBW_07415 [Bdellovibrionota bacterium]